MPVWINNLVHDLVEIPLLLPVRRANADAVQSFYGTKKSYHLFSARRPEAPAASLRPELHSILRLQRSVLNSSSPTAQRVAAVRQQPRMLLQAALEFPDGFLPAMPRLWGGQR